MNKELLIKLAMAMHAADVAAGQIFTSLEDLGEAGRRAYFKDAQALLEVAPAMGVVVTVREVE